jgi:hypothetical protein
LYATKVTRHSQTLTPTETAFAAPGLEALVLDRPTSQDDDEFLQTLVGTGFLTAALFLRSQLGETLQPPAPSYYVLVLAGLIASLAIIASTLPMLQRVTGPDAARDE